MRNDAWDRQELAKVAFRIGDRVRVVQGPDRGRIGVITGLYPKHARPYCVRLREGWYVHFAADRLMPVREEVMPLLSEAYPAS